jgi:hypothetical protein
MEYLVGPVAERKPLYIGEQRGRLSLRFADGEGEGMRGEKVSLSLSLSSKT